MLGIILVITQSIYDFAKHPWNICKIKQWICEYGIIIVCSNIILLYVYESSLDFAYIFYIFLFHNVLFFTGSWLVCLLYTVLVLYHVLFMGPVLELFPVEHEFVQFFPDRGVAHLFVLALGSYYVVIPYARNVIVWVLDQA